MRSVGSEGAVVSRTISNGAPEVDQVGEFRKYPTSDPVGSTAVVELPVPSSKPKRATRPLPFTILSFIVD
jgi:hypothetical protein